jgi:protein transport protein SEC31
LKQTTPASRLYDAESPIWLFLTQPQQRRLVDDLERRINPLFDALNCETLSKPVVDRLLTLTKGDLIFVVFSFNMMTLGVLVLAMEARDRPAALALHVELLTTGSETDDIALWMSGIKQLITRL